MCEIDLLALVEMMIYPTTTKRLLGFGGRLSGFPCKGRFRYANDASAPEPVVGQPAMMIINGIIICAHSSPSLLNHAVEVRGCAFLRAFMRYWVKNENYNNIQQ